MPQTEKTKNQKIMDITIEAKPMQFEKQFEIKLENISQVYRGKLDQCRCGCGGDFLYTQNEADRMNVGRDKHFMKGSNVAIKNALKKFQSGKFPITHNYNDITKEMCFQIHTHDNELVERDERMGVAIYTKA